LRWYNGARGRHGILKFLPSLIERIELLPDQMLELGGTDFGVWDDEATRNHRACDLPGGGGFEEQRKEVIGNTPTIMTICHA
jgi:hypothetical protein